MGYNTHQPQALIAKLKAMFAAARLASGAAGSSMLLGGEKLHAGQWISGGNGYLLMESSGDLVVCSDVQQNQTACEEGKKLWSAGTSGNPGAYVQMQEFGTLAIFSASSKSPYDRLWQSGTMIKLGCNVSSTKCAFLDMQKDANCVMYKGANPASRGVGAAVWSTATTLPPLGAKNVLHIVIDDLRPEMKLAYKQSYMRTPNFDRIAAAGLTFDQAYCQIAVCAPSRSSFMSGLRPDATAIYNFQNDIREPGQPHITTTPGQFMAYGYTVLGGGKTFHYNRPKSYDDLGGSQGSWSSHIKPYFYFREFTGSYDMTSPIGDAMHLCPGGASACVVDGPMEQFYDYRLANATIDSLRTAMAGTRAIPQNVIRPWYIMAGFRRPHRDFYVHRKYWDLYPPAEQIQVAADAIQSRDPSQPEIAFHPAGVTLANGTTVPGDADTPWPKPVQQWFRRGYYAAVTQTDACIGMVLDALEGYGQEVVQNTIVIAHADHGWQLGEHGLWDKQTEFEHATRVPMIVAVPWKPKSHGRHTIPGQFAELVDLHPTLATLAGIPSQQYTPPVTSKDYASGQFVGQDLSPLFDVDYGHYEKAAIGAAVAVAVANVTKSAAFSQWPSCGIVDKEQMCINSRAALPAMGYSIRTQSWRLTVWVPFNGTTYTGIFAPTPLNGTNIAVELYDHRQSSPFDFNNDGEQKNVALHPNNTGILLELYKTLVAQYSYSSRWLQQRRAQFRKGQLKYMKARGFDIGFQGA